MVLVKSKDKAKYPTVAALLAAAKAVIGSPHPRSSGDGSPQHLAGLMFETRTKRQAAVHVPWHKGGARRVQRHRWQAVWMPCSP